MLEHEFFFIAWIMQDIVLSISCVFVIPLAMRRIVRRVETPIPDALSLAGNTLVLFCVIMGLSHVNWSYMPTSFPTSLYVLHVASAIGSVSVAFVLLLHGRRIADSLNELAEESSRRIAWANLEKLQELTKKMERIENGSE